MPRFIDLTGQSFYRWTVLARDISSTKQPVRWICKCDCGNKKSIDAHSLRRGSSKSCGCLSVEELKNKPIKINDVHSTILAYYAGLFDAESCIDILRFGLQTPEEGTRRSPAYILRIKVRMVYKPVIISIKNTFGVGHIHKRTSSNSNIRTTWEWICYTYDAIFILQQLIPYLHIKKQEASIALFFAEVNHRCTFGQSRVPTDIQVIREDLYQKLRALKHIEWQD